MKLVRLKTVKMMENIDEETADQIPQGFRNNIRWNVGHILVTYQLLIEHFAGKTVDSFPENYKGFFSPGTKPDDWGKDVPSLSDLKGQLQNQTDKLTSILSGTLDEPAAKPFEVGSEKLSTVGEIVNFSIYHEGLHQGFVNALMHAID